MSDAAQVEGAFLPAIGLRLAATTVAHRLGWWVCMLPQLGRGDNRHYKKITSRKLRKPFLHTRDLNPHILELQSSAYTNLASMYAFSVRARSGKLNAWE